MAGPTHDGGDAQASLKEFGFLSVEGPGVGEAFAAVIAGENHDGVARGSRGLERFQDAADLQVHLDHHAAIGLNGAGVEAAQSSERLRERFIVRTLPGPVRRVEMQADEEGLAIFHIAVNRLDGLFGEQVCQITVLVDFDIVIPQVVRVGLGAAGFMCEIIQTASAESPEMIVATLERPEIGERAEMPFAE